MADSDEMVEPEETRDPLAGDPVEQPAVTGRPADTAPENSTFGSRRANGGAEPKAVQEAENKAVRRSPRKKN
jgi:hypothetical protein